MIERSKDRLVRLPEVRNRTGLSTATIYRKMAEGRFPKAVKISSMSVAWYEAELNAWVQAPSEWQTAA